MRMRSKSTGGVSPLSQHLSQWVDWSTFSRAGVPGTVSQKGTWDVSTVFHGAHVFVATGAVKRARQVNAMRRSPRNSPGNDLK